MVIQDFGEGRPVRDADVASLRGEEGTEIVGMLRLAIKKPWAIDTSFYFAKCDRPLYLVGGCNAGKTASRNWQTVLSKKPNRSPAWPADAIRLDAYDADAGAGGFYASCGCTEGWSRHVSKFATDLLRVSLLVKRARQIITFSCLNTASARALGDRHFHGGDRLVVVHPPRAVSETAA